MTLLANIPIEQIRHRPDARLRTFDALSSLAESIKTIGLLQPIRVRRIGAGYEVVAGSHRLQACDALGHTEIACFVVDDDDLNAEMAMIAENLHRAELTKLDHDEQVARWAALAVLRLSDNLSESPPTGRPGIAASASRELGIDEREVQRALKVASLSAEAKVAAREAGLDNNRAALLSAARLPTPTAQVEAIQQHQAQRARGIAGRYVPKQVGLSIEALFDRFVDLCDKMEALPVAELIDGSGRNRAILGQRASGLADRMEEILEGLSQ